MSAWEHPELGSFEYELLSWEGFLDLPALQAFDCAFGADDDTPGHYPLVFEVSNQADDVPSPAAVAIVLKLIANQGQFAQAVANAMWDDFTGRGPKSGMWWHGHLEDVTDENDSGLPSLDGPQAIFAWMRTEKIFVRNAGVRASEPPLIEVTFAAPFEGEHSVGILTDGLNVLGTGYALDVEPFQSE